MEMIHCKVMTEFPFFFERGWGGGGTSAFGATREGAYSGEGAYFVFEKQPNL